MVISLSSLLVSVWQIVFRNHWLKPVVIQTFYKCKSNILLRSYKRTYFLCPCFFSSSCSFMIFPSLYTRASKIFELWISDKLFVSAFSLFHFNFFIHFRKKFIFLKNVNDNKKLFFIASKKII